MRIVIWSPLHLIEPLLVDAGLPTDDIDAPAIRWVVAMEGEGIAACGGLQWLDATTALLRSLAVAPERRGEGIGGSIHDRLLAEATGAGITHLYLLTTTASDWFTVHGWVVVDRVDAPEIVKTSSQFATLCPDTAVLMRKDF